MGELCVEDIRREQIMALPSVLNYRIWSLGPRSLPGLANRRGHASKTRKNLFGPVDHDENLRFVHQELEKISREDSDRWNFDFKTEQPKEGRFEWKAVPESPSESRQSSPLTCLTNNTNKKQVKRLQSEVPSKMKQKLCTDYFRKTSHKSQRTVPKAKDTVLCSSNKMNISSPNEV